MRKMLLSMQPFWFEKVMSGTKIYEYRNRFPNEEIEAYIYVSNPVKAIAGILYLGPRIEVKDWQNKYIGNAEVVHRIDDYISRNKYAMPIIATQRIQPISVKKMNQLVEKFIIPESYYYFENYEEIANAIECNVVYDGSRNITEPERFRSDREICRNYREE